MSWVPRGAQRCEERVARQLDSERGRRPVPGIDRRLRRESFRERPQRLDERVPVAAGEVGASNRAGEEHIAGKEGFARVVREVTGRVARDLERLERDPGEVEAFVAGEQDVRGIGACSHARRDEVRQVLEQPLLVLGHVDRRLGALGEVGDAEEVIPMAVRDQDRRALRAECGELEPQLPGIAARVDHDRFAGTSGAADDVAVRPDRAKLVAVDDDAHARFTGA